MRALVCLALLAGVWLIVALPASATSPLPRTSLEELRLLYLASVEDASAISRAREEIEQLRETAAAPRGSELEAVLTAYEGALTTLQAKHAAWPPQKLRYLRDGLAVLDQVVESRPDAIEPRYLRLMSCFYLPGILGRSASVREDFAALARLLPPARDRYPAELYRAIATFVLENGNLAAAERSALERSLAG